MKVWDKEQAFDVLDTLKQCGVYPTMLSAIPYIMESFKLNEAETRRILLDWAKSRKKS